MRTSFHAPHLELFTVSPGVPPPGHLPFHVLRSGEHQLALLISFRIHRLSRGCALEPCQNKPRLKHAWSPYVCPSAARPCPYVWQPVHQSTPKACPLFVLHSFSFIRVDVETLRIKEKLSICIVVVQRLFLLRRARR